LHGNGEATIVGVEWEKELDRERLATELRGGAATTSDLEKRKRSTRN